MKPITTYENKKLKVTFSNDDKRVLEIFPNDIFVPYSKGEHQYLFDCTLIEISKHFVIFEEKEYEESDDISTEFKSKEKALLYFKEEDLIQKKDKVKVEGKLTRKINSKIIYPMDSIRTIMFHHTIVEETFQKR